MARTKRDIQHELILLRLRRGDETALEELIQLWERPLFYYLRRLLDREEDVWDVLQDVWLKTFRHIGGLRDAGALPAWLYKTARNAAISLLRKSQRWEPIDDADAESGAVEIESRDSFLSHGAMDLHNAVNQLSLPHREAITLHFLENFTLAEIAEITDVNLGTIKSRLHYAKLELKERLRDSPRQKETERKAP